MVLVSKLAISCNEASTVVTMSNYPHLMAVDLASPRKWILRLWRNSGFLLHWLHVSCGTKAPWNMQICQVKAELREFSSHLHSKLILYHCCSLNIGIVFRLVSWARPNFQEPWRSCPGNPRAPHRSEVSFTTLLDLPCLYFHSMTAPWATMHSNSGLWFSRTWKLPLWACQCNSKPTQLHPYTLPHRKRSLLCVCWIDTLLHTNTAPIMRHLSIESEPEHSSRVWCSPWFGSLSQQSFCCSEQRWQCILWIYNIWTDQPCEALRYLLKDCSDMFIISPFKCPNSNCLRVKMISIHRNIVVCQSQDFCIAICDINGCWIPKEGGQWSKRWYSTTKLEYIPVCKQSYGTGDKARQWSGGFPPHQPCMEMLKAVCSAVFQQRFKTETALFLKPFQNDPGRSIVQCSNSHQRSKMPTNAMYNLV